ncbi:MAG: ribonuclease Y [Candidatus Cloacimonetes bacterium]|nr:ribonuclease Y [Candidatus Cloacimonadota bacterium]
MLFIYIIIGITIGIIISAILFYMKKIVSNKEILSSTELAKKIVDDANRESETIRKTAKLDGKDKWYKTQKKYEEDISIRKKELRSLEKKYNDRLVNLDNRLENLERKDNQLQKFEKTIKNRDNILIEKEKTIEELITQQNDKLSEIAGLTRKEAVQILKSNLKNKAKNEAAKEIREIQEKTKLGKNKIVADILATTIQRVAVDYVSESTVSVVSLPDNEMKGRIIGREGRNIRSFENTSGVDLIIDDTPEAVILSCFDPIRREIAKNALEKLITDGRIHPGRIESVIEKTQKEMDDKLITIGEKACLDMNIHNISPNIIKTLGRLHYRTSYGQNILKHSMESGWICGILAAELNLNQELARRAGFLHDLGKAVDHEFDGSHASLGANIARKNGESKLIVNAIAAHHEEVEYESVYAVLTQVADAISGARPGSRREMLETYMKRLEQMEEIANSIEGVHKSYAIQAGRELRIIVDPAAVNDSKTAYIASDIASRIEGEMQYPGQVKVTVIRQTRQSAIAK